MTRQEILDTAASVVTKDRDAQYGPAEDSFGAIRDLWNAYLADKITAPLTSIDVSILMLLLKVARTKNKPDHKDNWVDMAGYAACGGEIATKESKT